MLILSKIAYFSILGLPLIVYLGILTFLCVCFTALIGYSNFKGKAIVPFKWHFRMAAISITLAIIHGILALSLYL